MFKVLKFIIFFVGTYIAAVAGLWGVVELYTYFRGEELKNLLGVYWWLMYCIPIIPAVPVALIKCLHTKNDNSNPSGVDIIESVWNNKVKPRLGFRGQVSLYLKDLVSKIREMPFIYKGLEGYVNNDFVDVQIQPLDVGTLAVKEVFSGAISTNEKLRDSKKIIILGGGGIGKTTFQRHTILEIISSPKPSVLHEKDKVIPIYIPLKAVDNSSRFPILRYILQNISFLSNHDDIDRLIKLARANHLFLFLDGYDEIQFAGTGASGKNFVRDELNFMFSYDETSALSFLNANSKYREFYKSVENCRIWLSSRKEFFEQHPISINAPSVISKVKCIELSGIGDNRVKLINIIFDKYRKQSAQYAKFFNEEYFIQEIDETAESEIHKLSYNPLFLTIMCYIYAQKVIKHGKFDVKWGNSFNELIWECVTLLLRDLDEAKARDLPEAQKTALLRRRNSYQKEKEEFLLYFAKDLFHDEQNIFNLSYIKDKVRIFFKSQHNSDSGERIIKELENDSISQPNFALQLIFAGIFIIVDKSNKEVLYDFPHRRFREVLATKYYINYGNTSLLANLAKESFSELIYVYFQVSNDQDEILELILNNTKQHIGNNYFSALAVNCLSKKPPTYNPNRVLGEFFFICIDNNESFSLSSSILDYFQPSKKFIETIATKCLNFLHDKKIFSFTLCFDLLLRFDSSLLKTLSANTLAERLATKDDLALLVFLKHRSILEWFEENKALSNYLEFLLKMKDVFIPVLNKNKDNKIPYPQAKTPKYSYIITEEVFKDMKDFLRSKNLYMDAQTLSTLEGMQYNVYFSADFLYELSERFKIVKEFLLEKSRIDYQLYQEAMIKIEELNEPLQKINFFVS